MLQKKTLGLDIAVSLVALGFCFYRLFFGADFTDEGYYLALPWRFILGDRPFIDETYILQTAAIPILPFIKLFTLVKGSDGIIFFARLLYLIFALKLALVAYFTLKSKWQEIPFCTCLILALYIPYNNPGLSYNSLGRGLFIIGLFFGLWRLYLEKASPLLFFAGVAHSLAAFSYPTLLVPVGVFFFLLLFYYRPNSLRIGFIYIGGFFLPLVIIYFFLSAKFPDYLHTLEFTRTAVIKLSNSGSYSRFFDVLMEAKNSFPSLYILLPVPLIIYLTHKRSSFYAAAVYACLLLISFQTARPSFGGSGAQGTIILLGILCLFLLLFWSKRSIALNQLLGLVYFPSFIGALVMANTSGNGWNASALLYSACALVGLVILYERLEVAKNTLTLAFSTLILAVLLMYELTAMPDGLRKDLTVRLERGPYRGLYTSLEKKNYYEELVQLLNKVDSADSAILFYPHLPGAYLFTKMRPLTPNVWGGCQAESQNVCTQYIRNHSANKKYALRVKKHFLSKDLQVAIPKDTDHMDPFITSNSSLIEETSNFTLYRMNSR